MLGNVKFPGDLNKISLLYYLLFLILVRETVPHIYSLFKFIIMKFNYMLLSRLQRDCEYFLGHGNRSINHLWAITIDEHIKKMKDLYELLPEKPEWCTLEQILDYQLKMTK